MKSYYQNILSRLKSVNRLNTLFDGVGKIFIALTSFFLLSFLLIVTESIFHLPGKYRAIIVISLITVYLIIIILFLLYYLIKYYRPLNISQYHKIAKVVGDFYPSIKDKLLNAIQILIENKRKDYSEELIEASFQSIYNDVKNLNFRETVSKEPIKKNIRIFLFFASLTVLLFFSIPSLNSALYRLVNYEKDFTAPPRFLFEIEPGNTNVLKGDNINIRIKLLGDKLDKISLYSKTLSESEFAEKLLLADSAGNFNTTINSINESFEYFAEAENTKSEIFNISVINPPIIRELELVISPPLYSRLPQTVQKENGNISALMGSKVELGLTSTKELQFAEIIFSDSSKNEMVVEGANAKTDFFVGSDNKYFIQMVDTGANKNLNPILYTIKALEDRFPIIKVISPKEDIKVIGDEKLPVILQISDDYGFSDLQLKYRLSASQFDIVQEEFSTINIPFSKNKIEDEVYYVWDLKELYLAVEDVISYYFEVFDNDNVSGPKSVKSELFTLRVPSMDEIFNEAEHAQKESEDELFEMMLEADKLKEEIQKLSDELKKDEREIIWEEKEKIEDTVSQFKELENKVKDVQQKLSQTQEELEKNNLLSEETMKKYEELQKLMDELASEEMKEALAKLQKMMEQMNRNQIQDSFEEFKMNEEMFRKSLERTVNLLKRIQVEQKIDELVKRTEDIAERESELQEETEKSDLNDPQQNQELQDKQNEISEDLENLKKEMEKLDDLMSELSDMPKEEMEKMMEQMQQQQNQQLSEEAVKQMQKMQKMMAKQNQQQISQNMQQMNQMMQQMQQQMMMQNQMQMMAQMMKMINETLDLSKEQEALKEQTRNMPPNSEDYNSAAEQQEQLQQQLKNIMEQMSEMAQKTFAITPEMAKQLGDAMRQMQEAQDAMQERNSPMASQRQNGSMEALNKAASNMKGQMEGMMNPSSPGGGMMSLMQQLQQMSQQQMGINKLTQSMNQNGQLSPQQMGELARLAQEQQMIQKTLADLNKEAKETGLSKRISSNLDEILSELREVVTGMETQKIDDELVQAQERILSKMLDAQRSINERDYEKRRESESGKLFTRNSPEALDLNSKENRDRIRAELLKLSREGYSKDYEELIRKYFEALEKEEIKPDGN